jgi:uncharacterized cofD-like protein
MAVRVSRRRRVIGQWRWLVPGMGVKRHVAVLVLGLAILLLGFYQFARVGPSAVLFTRWALRLRDFAVPGLPLWSGGALLGLVGLALAWTGILGLTRSVVRGVGAQPNEALDRLFRQRALERGPRIVAVGGGTGLSNLLSGLKTYSANITAVVAVTDDGGSSGRLRRSLGMPAPGDLTDCYAALSDSPDLARLLLHRFDRGDELKGHTFGNLLIATLSEEQGDFASAALAVNEILNVRGRVVPAATRAATLVAEIEGGGVVQGESTLRERANRAPILRMHLEPPDVPAMDEAVGAVRDAELVVLGPGSLYTSVIPPLLVSDLGAAIRQTRARVVYVANIMSEPGETDGLTAFEHAQVVAAHLGRVPDLVLLNSGEVPGATIARYRAEGAAPVVQDLERFRSAGMIVRKAPLTRGGGQHDPRALALALVRLVLVRQSD